MGIQEDRFTAWLARSGPVRTRDDEAALLRAARAYDEAVGSSSLSNDRLDAVVQAASNAHAIVWENATSLLGILVLRWTHAAHALLRMSESRQAHVRFAALCCLRSETPTEIMGRLLRDGLDDRSSRVRWKAAQIAGSFEKRDLLPQLETTLAQETNARARGEIELQFLLLRDGYTVKPAQPSGFHVTVRIRNGICSSHVSEETMQAKGIEAVALELRKDR